MSKLDLAKVGSSMGMQTEAWLGVRCSLLEIAVIKGC